MTPRGARALKCLLPVSACACPTADHYTAAIIIMSYYVSLQATTRVIIYLRSSMTQSRHLMILHVHKEMKDFLELDKSNHFVGSNEHCLNVFGKFDFIILIPFKWHQQTPVFQIFSWGGPLDPPFGNWPAHSKINSSSPDLEGMKLVLGQSWMVVLINGCYPVMSRSIFPL